ncbi:T9SS type A sorting domain-containing protein [Echinicola sp. 20G]|uniref:T9SS type A sorting domain-containing protein n=1 Tax=Echinicola sp. 20G TaxID=2781961 RepID=UPI0019100DB0|nr:T9SS type A sorting domain-containing protein [Echinicola sp. 20G]
MNRKTYIILLFSLLLTLTYFPSKAQLIQLPVNHTGFENKNNTQRARLMADTLALPFWDDFSSSSLDSAKWINQGTNVSLNVGINAPSLGVALLDGVKANGQPYSTDITQSGVTDQLSSQFINLDGLDAIAQQSIYLSFFWQAGGKAELPDASDYLELLFLDSLNNWNQVWVQQGGQDIQEFKQEIIQVNGIYLHDHFQFKFQSTGRMAGPFDSWMIDYVYISDDRNSNDLYYQDRALTQLNSNFLGKYAALPLYEFNNLPDTVPQPITNQFFNLNDRFRAMEYSIEVRNKATSAPVMVLNSNTPFNPVPLANERRDFSSAAPGDWNLEEVTEEFEMESWVYLSSGDNYLIEAINGLDTTYHTNVDFRLNDTIKTTIPIKDFYAYDRGTVDYAAGINQRSGMIAIKYNTSAPAFINAISINFTNAAQRGNAVDLMIWSSLEENPLFTKEVIIQEKPSLEAFTKFELDTTISVEGDFYVGFMQFTNEFIQIGLDKSNDTSGEVMYNTSGTWQPNTEVLGSLMIRPHMQTTGPEAPETPSETDRIKAYPNPATEQRIFLEGEMDLVKMYDAFGREINIDIIPSEKGKIINFTGNHKGVYLIKVWKKNTPQSIRILVE